MKKMTWTEWKEHEKARRERFKEDGITDLNDVRTKKMWNDPNVADEDLPSVSFTYDQELNDFVKDD